MVSYLLVTRVCKTMLMWFLMTSVFATALPTALWAQDSDATDFEAPIIEHSILQAGIIGGVEVFGATVVDNEEIEKVSLFYRFSGETEFAELNMREIASSSFYSVKVDTANVPADTSAIEYYIQAEDTSGNIVLKGFAFQPLIRSFEIAEPALIATPRPEPDPAPVAVAQSRKINWLYVALSVLVVGGVAASLGGDSGGSGSDPMNPQDDCVGGCTVTVTFEDPL